MTTQQFLDRVFKDPKVKHHLDLFTQHEKNRLQMFERKDKVRIRCMVRDRDFVARPEEVVRQLALIHLHYTLGYPIDRLAVEVPVQMGSGVHEKAADVVVYRDPQRLITYIIVEVKKPKRRDGREQLHSYMNATGAPYGWWTNGRETSYEIRTEPNLFADLPRLPNVNETEEDVRQPIRKHELKPAEDLVALVLRMQEEVLANAGVNVFEEVFKLFFVKLWDEESASDDRTSPRSVCRFRVTAAPPEDQMERFQSLLNEAIDAHSGIFPERTEFNLSPEALAVVVSVLEKVRLSDIDMELMDHAFEYLLAPESKGDKGQYFTPRQVVRMAVKMLNPQPRERVLDPACGPCGFLIHTLLHVRDNFLRRDYPRAWPMEVQRYGSRRLYAVDFDPRVERVARFMMWLAGDGSANVFRMNSLDLREWRRDPRFLREVTEGGFDVIMTNPPFAGTIRHPEVLTRYDLAYKERLVRRQTKETVEVHRDRKRQNTMTRDVLFLERCLKWLKPDGRVAIVLPQGNLNNVGAEYIRREIMRRARILAVVGLHVNTFKPHTGTKTSVLFLQKWNEEQAGEWEEWYQATYDYDAAVDAYQRQVKMRDRLVARKKPIPAELSNLKPPEGPPTPPWDYPIFFATSKRSGRDNSGEPAYKKGPDGEILTEPKEVLVHNEEGDLVLDYRRRKVLDCDLDEIADAFITWGRKQGLGFLI
jgi:type I restriction enzyme M protein